MLTFETYNCDGMALSWGLSNATDGLFTKVVEYDYDLVVEKGSDVTIALNTVQAKLLPLVGKDVVSDCSRRLAGSLNFAAERQLDEMVIQEISSAPADTFSTSLSCKIKEATFAAETECYPVTGYISVYYLSSGDFGSDVSNIDQAIKYSVKDAIDGGALGTDTCAVHYLGDRETFYLDSSESSPSVARPDNDASTPWWVIIIVSSVGFVAMALACGFLYKKKISSRKHEVIVPIEVCTEQDFFPDELDGMEKFEEISEMTDEEKEDMQNIQAKFAMPSGCRIFECLNND
ncbi:hypothetical protein ACHAW5_005140 [Stephanodiscus triporus]|uniref:Uncharacterized protein n=1 Tax=Stephanodiscus triporus TaxID=2934178 RepID=A0ABD3PCU0_9STRA